MKRQIKAWSRDMMNGYRYAVNPMNKKKQDRIFRGNAMIKQKIFGCLVSLIAMALWMWLTLDDVKLIWIGAELFPAVCMGFWLMLTSRNIRREIREKYGD